MLTKLPKTATKSPYNALQAQYRFAERFVSKIWSMLDNEYH